MKKINIFVLALCTVVISLSGCYLPISGKVIDAETNQPIEGAVVLVEWTKTIGVGLTATISYKAVEVISDGEGKFQLPGCACPTANEPGLTIYKRGYVAWNSKFIFPDNKARVGFQWRANEFKLEPFLSSYSYDKHTIFIGRSIGVHLDTSNKRTIINASNWEHTKAAEEFR